MVPPPRQAAHFVEPVSAWTGWLRKVLALATVTRHHRATLTLPEYADRVQALCNEAARAATLWRGIWTLWRIEGLTYACADRSGGAFSLREISLPLEAGPPAACGLAMAAVLEVGFDAEAIVRVLERRGDPRFVDAAFETVGLMVAAYEPDLFGFVTAALGRVGLMRRYRLARPAPESFLAALPERWQPYAAHGFGRLLYFKRHDLRGVVRSLELRPYLSFTAALKGATAAYALVNSSDLSRILALVDQDLAPRIDAGIRDGLHNVLKLLAWSLPGCMDGLAATGPSSRGLLASALAEAKTRRRHGLGHGVRA